jgi:hypothetical protein
MNNCIFNSYILLIFSYFGICKRTNISAMIQSTSVPNIHWKLDICAAKAIHLCEQTEMPVLLVM